MSKRPAESGRPVASKVSGFFVASPSLRETPSSSSAVVSSVCVLSSPELSYDRDILSNFFIFILSFFRVFFFAQDVSLNR